MERRRFLIAAGAAGAAGLSAPAVAQSNPQIRWRVASSFPASLDTVQSGFDIFAKAIADMSGGAFRAELASSTSAPPPLEAMNAVAKGSVDACHTSSAYAFGRDPAFALGAAAPFGLNARQMNAWLRAGGGAQLLDEFYARHNLLNLPCGNTGAQMGGWFRKEIKTLDDLKGVKMRIAGLGGDIVRRLGGAPEQIAGAELKAALEKGGVDAAEWVGPYDDFKLGLHQAAKFYAYPGWWEGGSSLGLFVNRAKWDELPPAYKAMARAAAALADETVLARYDALNPRALRDIVAAGVKLTPFPREVMEAAYKASQDVYAELYASNAWFKRIHESQTAFRNEEVLWFRVAEMTFDGFMAQMQSRG